MTLLASNPQLADQGVASPLQSTDPLAAHLRDCFNAQGRAFGVLLAGESLHGLIAPRFCTTLFVVTGLLLLLGLLA